MTDSIRVSNVEFTAAGEADARRGLLGWVVFVLGDLLVVESVAVRRTRAGRNTLSFPRRVDRHGEAHYYCRPRDSAARRTIEASVFSQIGLDASERAS